MTNIPLCDDDNNEDDVVCLKIGRNYLHLGTHFRILGHKVGLKYLSCLKMGFS